MLTEQQLVFLRSEPGSNRVAKTMALAGVTQVTVAKALRLTQPYVSDVARGRYRTIAVENVWKFAAYFGCRIEDLFPSPRRPDDQTLEAPLLRARERISAESVDSVDADGECQERPDLRNSERARRAGPQPCRRPYRPVCRADRPGGKPRAPSHVFER